MTDVTQVATVPKKRGRKPVLTEEEKLQRKEENKKYMRERYKTVYGPIRDKSKKVQCECGEMVLEANAARHRRSKKCIDKRQANNELESDD